MNIKDKINDIVTLKFKSQIFKSVFVTRESSSSWHTTTWLELKDAKI